MKTKKYRVTGKEGANLRVLPSSLSETVKHLKHGEEVTVVEDFSAVNKAGGVATAYLCAQAEGRHLWAVAGNFAPVTEKINYLLRVAEKARSVYPLCVGKVHSGTDVGKVDSLAALKSHKALSCNRMASITMQEAGLLDKGVVVSHTKKRSGKKTIDDAVSNWRKLRHCKVVWVNKLYRDLPEEYKKAGSIYFQNSNACISAGGGWIWSCNRAKGYRYKGKSDYYRDSGYPFNSRILVVVIPEH